MQENIIEIETVDYKLEFNGPVVEINADLTNYYTKSETDDLMDNKQGTLTFDSAPISGSSNPVTSEGIYTALTAYYTKSEADAAFQSKVNLVTSVSSASTDEEYPSAKCMYDLLGDVETLINAL